MTRAATDACPSRYNCSPPLVSRAFFGAFLILLTPAVMSVVLIAALVDAATATSASALSILGSRPQRRRRRRPFTAVCTYSSLLALFSAFFLFLTSISIFYGGP
jgi:hypothetical protein